VRWTTAGLVRTLLSDPSIDMTLPLNGADCERPNDLSHTSAVLCDQATYSDPILRVVMGLFAPSGSAFKFDTDESILGKRICLAQDYDLSSLNGEGRNWASEQRVVVLRQPTLLDCIVAVQGSKADAFAATDLEGRHLLGRLGLQELFAMGERPLATLSLHAVVSSEHPRGPELLDALNRGLEQLRQSKAYAAIVQKHLMGRWHAPGDIPAIAVAAAAPVTKSSAEGPLPPVEPLARNTSKIAPPVMLPVDRERALRFLKRGDEELAEGRVAAARQLYERAAEMGLAQAAMALAGTYDAAELTGPNLRNVQPNITEARRWYERARALGANDADRRLLRLGAR
jgi:Bacterial extracellular solute-binding proteins, family 3